MTNLKFTADLLTGHEEVDRQHTVMFKWYEKIVSGGDSIDLSYIQRAIHFLSTYITYHFAAEELLMEQLRYKRLPVHVKQHDMLRVEVKAIQDTAQAGQPSRLLIARIDGLFREWYIHHIRQWDKAFIDFLKRKQSLGEASQLPSLDQLLRADKLNEDEIDISVITEVD